MLKFIKKFVYLGGLTLLILIVAGIFLYRGFFAPKVDRYLTEKIQETLARQFNREVSVGQVQLNFPNPQIIISNLEIARQQKLAEGTLLAAKEVKAKILLRSLISRYIIIDDVVIDSPTVWIEFDAQGQSNLPKFGGETPEEPPQEEPSRFHPEKLAERLHIPQFQLVDAQIYVAHRQIPLTVAIDRLDITASLTIEDLHANVKIALEGGEIDYQDRGKIQTAIAGEVELHQDTLHFSSFRLEAGSSTMTIDGTLENFHQPQADLAVVAQLSLDELDRYADINQNLSGLVDFDGTVTGEMPDIIAQGHMRCQQGTAWKLAFADASLDAQASYQEKRLTISNLQGQMFEGRVTGDGELSFAGTPSFAAAVTLTNGELEYVNTLIDQELQLAGRLTGEVEVKGDSFRFEDLTVQTSLALEDGYAYGVTIPRAQAQGSIQQRTLSINALDGEVFEGRAQGTGTLTLYDNFPYQADLDVQQIALEPIMQLLPTPPEVAGRISGTLSAQGTDFDLEHLALEADLNAQDVVAYDIPAKTIAASSQIQDSTLSIETLSAQLFGGTIQGNGKLVLAGEHSLQFATDLTVQDLSVQSLMRQFAMQNTDTGFDIDGTIAGAIQAAGSSFDLEAIQGTVDLKGTGNITLPASDEPQEDAQNTFPLDLVVNGTLRDNLVTLSRLTIESSALQVETEGTINLSTPAFDLQYQVATRAIQTLMQQILAFIPGLDATSPLAQFTGQIEYLRGTIQGPLQQPDIKASVECTQADFVWFQADAITADVTYQGTSLAIQQVRASYNSAIVEARGTLDLASPSNPVLDIPVSLQSGKVSDYLTMFKQDLLVEGTLSQIQATIQGAIDRLNADLVVTITEGEAWGQSFERLSGEMSLVENRLLIESLTVRQQEGQISLTGYVGFDLAFQANLTATNISVSDIDAAQQIAKQYQGQMDVTLEASGTIDDPQGQAQVLFHDLSYNGRPIEDVTGNVQLADQTLQASLETFRQKFTATLQLALTPDFAYQADMNMERAAVEQLLALAGEFEGITGTMTGKITSKGNLTDMQQLTANVQLSELDLDIFGQPIENDEAIDLVVTQQKLTVNSLELKGEELGLFVQGFLDFQGNFDLDVDGIVDLRPVLAFLPESLGITSLEGRVQLICSLRGTFQSPQLEGIAEINQGNVQVEAYPDPSTDIHGKLAFTPGKIEILQLQGNVSRGEFTTSGTLAYTGMAPEDFTIDVNGKNILVQEIVPSLTLTISPRVRLSGDLQQQKLAGELLVQEMLYSKDLNFQEMIFDKSRTIALPEATPDTPQNQLALDLFINAPKNLKVNNKLADLELRANLHVQGTLAKPRLDGRVEMLEGEIVFGDITYDIITAVFEFLDTTQINPDMNIQAETVVQGYEISLIIEGNLEQFALTMNSNPPLPEAEIARLLAVGSESGGGGYNFVTKPLQTLVEGRIEKAVKLDRFTVDVDPLLSESDDSEAVPTVTLGKRLFEDLLLTFTTSVGGTEQAQIVEVEYEFSDNLSLTARRTEDGEFDTSFTYKFTIK
ncbi:AsmA family protein [candidate division KSB3 bacterium]|uniref:AsmA family protein n=1 Tax=candidate division KSB3 bacterium TaxID=2044937 RepID=A0A9D5Q7V0_9BACT|nr:AsmA family protein [candidate division KSB3 bacterium]MBD3327254.1 AsmA family protein [candidate division KSB3 bacterium]